MYSLSIAVRQTVNTVKPNESNSKADVSTSSGRLRWRVRYRDATQLSGYKHAKCISRINKHEHIKHLVTGDTIAEIMHRNNLVSSFPATEGRLLCWIQLASTLDCTWTHVRRNLTKRGCTHWRLVSETPPEDLFRACM